LFSKDSRTNEAQISIIGTIDPILLSLSSNHQRFFKAIQAKRRTLINLEFSMRLFPVVTKATQLQDGRGCGTKNELQTQFY
jgi:hypothetical protein